MQSFWEWRDEVLANTPEGYEEEIKSILGKYYELIKKCAISKQIKDDESYKKFRKSLDECKIMIKEKTGIG